MGRKKINIELISDDRIKRVTFKKYNTRSAQESDVAVLAYRCQDGN